MFWCVNSCRTYCMLGYALTNVVEYTNSRKRLTYPVVHAIWVVLDANLCPRIFTKSF